MSWILLLALVQSWVPGRPLPTPRFAAVCVAVGDRVYLAGGAVGTPQRPVPTGRVDVYDVAADTWQTGLAPLPEPRLFAAGAFYEGRLYVIGGSDGRRGSTRVDRYNPDADRWETVTPLPDPVEALAATVFEGRLYVIGGFAGCCRNNYRRAVLRFVSEGAGRWEPVDSLNVPRAGLAAAVAGGRLYAIGGRYFNDLGTAEYLTRFGWAIEPERMNTPRSGHSAAGYDRFIAVAAGMDRNGTMNSVEVLNTRTGRWTEVKPLSHDRVYAGMALAAGRLVVLGGWNRHGLVESVETHEPFHIPGVAESPGSEPARPVANRVARAGFAVSAGEYELRDITGSLVARGQGPALLTPAPGVYFLRYPGDSGITRLTIIK